MSNDDEPSGPQYEDFEPCFEWQGDNKNKLVIYLPGFSTISLAIKRTAPCKFIVSGICKVENNKFKRFEHEFTTPKDDFMMEEIDMRFKDELFTITMPTMQTKKHNQLHDDQMQNKEEKPKTLEKPHLAHHHHNHHHDENPLPKFAQKCHIEPSYDEAKQLVVNVVVAGLVIVALGAYILITK
ncbi:unnamed protein product [Cuscuta campestris]|uniref:SHSP domain-containing protein n=1 Tax=Cuscuta campestris TaxID=132261 RepID=A0A484KQR6_9ASTE|nr:unnamed protein product [Cuscuta campestris]